MSCTGTVEFTLLRPCKSRHHCRFSEGSPEWTLTKRSKQNGRPGPYSSRNCIRTYTDRSWSQRNDSYRSWSHSTYFCITRTVLLLLFVVIKFKRSIHRWMFVSWKVTVCSSQNVLPPSGCVLTNVLDLPSVCLLSFTSVFFLGEE